MLNINNAEIKNAFLGNKKLNKIYMGNYLIYIPNSNSPTAIKTVRNFSTKTEKQSFIELKNQILNKAFLGEIDISKIFLGNNLVYSNNTEIKHTERYGFYMTANNKPAPFEVTASQNVWGAYRAFTESLEDDLSLTGLTQNTSQWVQIKLDKKIKIWSIKMCFRTTVSNKDTTQVPYKFKILGSNNAIDFEEIFNCESCNPDLFCKWEEESLKYNFSNVEFVEINCNNEYQYYRVEFFNSQTVSKGKVTSTEANEIKITLLNLYQKE